MKKTLFTIAIGLLFNILSSQTFAPLPSHITVNRPYPLMDFATPTIIDVESYSNVNADDNLNDGAGISQAINDAIALKKPVKIVFKPNGKYYIDPVGFGTHHLEANLGENIILEGNNCEWIMKNSSKPVMKIHQMKNFIIRNISIDYEILPFTQGIVTNVDVNASTFTWEKDPDPKFPTPQTISSIQSTYKWGQLKDADGSLKDGSRNLYLDPSFTNIGGNTYKITNFNKTVVENIDKGDYFIYLARSDSRLAFYTEYSEQVTFNNVTIYANIGGGFENQHNKCVNIINSKVIPREGRLHSVNADGIHNTGDYLGVWVEGCTFKGFPDDFANLKHLQIQANSQGARQLSVWPTKLEVGNVIKFYNEKTGIESSTVTVTKLLNADGTTVELDVNHNKQPGDIAYLVSRSNQGFIFRNNVIEGNRSWGIITQSTQGQIKGNVFRNISSGGVKLSNIPGWYQVEGLYPSYVEVTENQFYNCGTDKESLLESGKATIMARTSMVTGEMNGALRVEKSANFKGIKNIWITKNYIEYNRIGMLLQDVDCLVLEGNTLVHKRDSYEQNSIYQGENTPMLINNVNFCDGQNLRGISVYPTEHRLTQLNQVYDGLSATVVPLDAPNTNVTWSSSNETVAKVDPSTGVVTAVGEGYSYITATNAAGHTDSCIITVGFHQIREPQIHFMLNDPAGTSKPENIGQMVEIDGAISNPSIFKIGTNDAEKGLVASSSGTGGHILLYDTLDSYPGQVGSVARTYTYWVKPTEIMSYNNIVYNGTGFNNIIAGYDQYGALLFRHKNSNYLRFKEKLPLNKWNHVAFVLPENGKFKDAKFYLNGVLCTIDTSAWDYNPNYNELIVTPGRQETSVFQIGSEFKGFLYDWRYYDYALTAQEIQNVIAPIAVTSLSINPNSLSMAISQTSQLNASVGPQNASDRFVRWSSNNEAVATVNPITGEVKAVSNGTAEITATSISNPNVTAKSTINIGTLSTNENNDLNNIQIYPNPVRDILNIDINTSNINLSASIVDLSGRVILNEKLKNSKNTINLSSLSEGVYLLYLKEGDKVLDIKKIVSNH